MTTGLKRYLSNEEGGARQMSKEETKIIPIHELEGILQQHSKECQFPKKVDGTQGLCECTTPFLECAHHSFYDRMAHCMKYSWK